MKPALLLLSLALFVSVAMAQDTPQGTAAVVPRFDLTGFATVGFTVTGGTGGETVTVTNLDQFNEYSTSRKPCIIQVAGMIPVSGMNARIGSDKTVVGVGTNAGFVGGGLYLHTATNVIIRNLTVDSSSDDSCGLVNSQHVWVDHCTFKNARDGNLDMNRGTDNVTVSWCHIYYETEQPHALASLLGSSDRDFASSNKLHVTYHHNWFGKNIKERMPSNRFGTVHLFNNYYHAPGNNYCIRTRLFAQSRIENNYFQEVKNPWEVYITDPAHAVGRVYARSNFETNVIWGVSTTNASRGLIVKIVPGTADVFTPPYAYTPDPATAVPHLVTHFAGAGKGPFAASVSDEP